MNGQHKLGVHNHGKTEDISLNSVYCLLTKLCEKLLNGHKDNVHDKLLRKCRSKAFEILLSKKIPPQEEPLLEDNDDPYCHLLAWQFILINEHNLTEHVNKLQKCISILQTSNTLNQTLFSNVLYVLLRLCRVPEQKNVISVSDYRSKISQFLMYKFVDKRYFNYHVGKYHEISLL